VTADIAPEREVLAWSEMQEATRSLAHTIHDSGFRPDFVLAIARGGLIIAGALSYALGVKNTAAMSVEFYTGVDQRLEVPMILPPVPDLIDLDNSSLLIVDDVADTGATLQLVRDFVAPRVAEVRTVCLYEKPHSVIRCDYVWRHTDRWIVFPWSAEPPVFGEQRDA
jgi:uncharacterized protein